MDSSTWKTINYIWSFWSDHASNKYYPCFSCHNEEAGCIQIVWSQVEFDRKVIPCGVCGHELSIKDYKN